MSSESDDTSDEDGPRYAADEPTAMWDESLMRDAGYDDLAADRGAKPRAETGPATTRGVGGEDAAPVHVSPTLTGGHASLPRPKPEPAAGPSGLSWVVTGVLAVGLGVVVYLIIQFLR